MLVLLLLHTFAIVGRSHRLSMEKEKHGRSRNTRVMEHVQHVTCESVRLGNRVSCYLIDGHPTVMCVRNFRFPVRIRTSLKIYTRRE